MHLVNLNDLKPLLVYEYKLFAPARVRGRDTLAHLDTGASDVSISSKLAEGLLRIGQAAVQGAYEQSTVDVVEDVEVEFMGRSYRVAARLGHEAVHHDEPFATDVTLNAPVLYGQPVIFDFRLLHLALPHQLAVESWAELDATYLARTDLCLLKLHASGDAPVVVLFDTGAGVSVLNAAHVSELPLDLKPAYALEVGDVTGQKAEQPVYRCANLRVADKPLPAFDCIQVDLRSVESAIGQRFDVILGANVMLKSGLRWLFDKGAGKVRVAE
ncbi:MAG: pepsin/retropepsin-like aspartic protease family protein [Candidatus Brachytrichaceae bacterium NZ_4S206]|jgi:hypothetical protein